MQLAFWMLKHAIINWCFLFFNQEDLVNIQKAFQEEHGVNFRDWVNRECSAEYRDLLVAVLNSS